MPVDKDCLPVSAADISRTGGQVGLLQPLVVRKMLALYHPLNNLPVAYPLSISTCLYPGKLKNRLNVIVQLVFYGKH